MRRVRTVVLSGFVLGLIMWRATATQAGASQASSNGYLREDRREVHAVHVLCFASSGRVGLVDAFPPLQPGVIIPQATSCAQAEVILIQEGFQLQGVQAYYSDFVYFVFLKTEKLRWGAW